jgi:hypothetical protein
MKKWSVLFTSMIASLSLVAQLSLPAFWQDAGGVQPDYAFLKTQIIQQRLTGLMVESFDGATFEETDSVYYNYSGTNGHNNYDFIGLSNFLYEPWYDDAGWLQFDGVMWQDFMRMNNTFNEEGLRSQVLLEIYDGAVWVDYLQVMYTYNADEQVINSDMQIYSGGTWLNNAQQEFIYTEGRLTELYINIWDGFVWQNNTKNVYSYGPGGILEYITTYLWDGAYWDSDYRQIYYYDADDRLSEKLNQDYGMGWFNTDRLLYMYDSDGFNEQVTRQTWDGINFNDVDRWLIEPHAATMWPGEIIEQEWDGVAWEYYYRYTCSYEDYDDGTVAVEEEPTSYAMTIFPNPAHDVVKITLRSKYNSDGFIQLFDLSGQVVATANVVVQEGQNLFFIHLGELGVAQGQYILHLRTDHKIFKGKLTVQ